MRVLVLNGSPKGERSNTLRLTRAFLAGLAQEADCTVKLLSVAQLSIGPCRGCFHCWRETPGQCLLNDDMAEVMAEIVAADVLIWSFPLYYYGLPSGLKALMDRQLPMLLPFMTQDTETGAHPQRYDLSGQRQVLISTCGFYTAEGNYDAIRQQFDHCYGQGGYTTLFCGQGELFRVPELAGHTDRYLAQVQQAGREFARGAVSAETAAQLAIPLFPREAFEQMADASWGVAPDEPNQAQSASAALAFTRQMAALYNPAAWPGRDQVLEFCYTDCEETIQMVLGPQGAVVLTDERLIATTRIETPLNVWQRIGRGELNGQEALMQHLYRVTGDFTLMVRWDDYFGPAPAPAAAQSAPRQTNMLLMLTPWLLIWSVLAMAPTAGAALGIACCALLPLAFLRWQATLFDALSLAAATLVCLLTLLGGSLLWLLPLSYLLFGLMWSVTVFLPLPLSAYYSQNDYGGGRALANPLFIRTNRILTACWGVLYLLTPIWTYGLLLTPLAPWIGAINSLFPAALGLFTLWFQKWYPAAYARRGAGA